MRRPNLALFAIFVVASYKVMPMPANSKPKVDWKAYHLNVENVHACAFAPDSHSVALLYWKDHLLSETPWKDVYTTYLAVWDLKTGRVEEKLKWDYTSNSKRDPWPNQARYIRYSDEGHYLVVLGATAIRVLDTATYTEVKKIAYDPPKEPVPFQGIIWATVGLSLTPDGSRAAVAISSSGGAGGGFVRVYDLKTGQVVREWKLREGVFSVSDVALSADGERVAVSWLPSEPSSDPEAFIPTGTDNVRVMDVKTGETLAGVSTKYFAGPVHFGPNGTLLTGSINDDRKGYSLDTIKVWDAKSGKLLREINAPHTGVHYRLDLSHDGKLLLGYTGTEKPVENFVTVDTQQFQIWDFASGQPIATSPEFGPNKDEIPRIQLSADGKFVVVWWGDGFAKPVVYEVPQP
jgi:WD40 repeat protein